MTIETSTIEQAGESEEADSGAAKPGSGQAPRFHLFIIDAGWKTEPAKVLRENFLMIRVFQFQEE